MAHLFWLREKQLERTGPFLPQACGVSHVGNRVDNSQVWCGTIHVTAERTGLAPYPGR